MKKISAKRIFVPRAFRLPQRHEDTKSHEGYMKSEKELCIHLRETLYLCVFAAENAGINAEIFGSGSNPLKIPLPCGRGQGRGKNNNL